MVTRKYPNSDFWTEDIIDEVVALLADEEELRERALSPSERMLKVHGSSRN